MLLLTSELEYATPCFRHHGGSSAPKRSLLGYIDSYGPPDAFCGLAKRLAVCSAWERACRSFTGLTEGSWGVDGVVGVMERWVGEAQRERKKMQNTHIH